MTADLLDRDRRRGHSGAPLKVGSAVRGQSQTERSGSARTDVLRHIVPFDLDMPREITVNFTQIQYTQTVLLNFNGLTWPHVSVNTLVPADDIVVPASVWK